MLLITPIPALESNYFWLIQPDQQQPLVYLVDPGDAQPVIALLTAKGLMLGAILITHHHRDHTQGINDLLEHRNVPVYGPRSERIPQITHVLYAGDRLTLGYLEFSIIGVPGHTLDHIAYYLPAATPAPILFCGDALFAGGCGRRFEGSAEMMWESLLRLAELPGETQVYCGHEYTLSNLSFAIHVEPANDVLQKRLLAVEALREQHLITLPTTIALERLTNPFLRCQMPDIERWVTNHSDKQPNTAAEVFGLLRQIKDNWQ